MIDVWMMVIAMTSISKRVWHARGWPHHKTIDAGLQTIVVKYLQWNGDLRVPQYSRTMTIPVFLEAMEHQTCTQSRVCRAMRLAFKSVTV